MAKNCGGGVVCSAPNSGSETVCLASTEGDREEKGEEEEEWERMMEAVDRACENDKKWMRMIQASWDCGDCGKELKERMMMDCNKCGEGIEEEEINQTIIGLDVVGVFTAMKSKNTRRIISRSIIKSKIKTRASIEDKGIGILSSINTSRMTYPRYGNCSPGQEVEQRSV